MADTDLLSQNREFISGALAAIGDGVIITDLAGKIVFLNESAEKITGWSSTEAVKQDFHGVFRLYDSASYTAAQNPISRVIEAMTAIGLKENCFFVTREGIRKYLSASCAPIQQPGEGFIGIVVVFRDVTKYRIMEETCKKEEANLRRIFNAMPVGMCVVDASLVIQKTNVTVEKLMGNLKEGAIGKRFGNVFGCQGSLENEQGCGYGANRCQLCEVRAAVALGFAGLPTEGIEYEHSRVQDGKRRSFWFQTSVTPVVIGATPSVVVVLVDITDRKNAEEVLHRYKLLSEKARDIILFIDRDSNQILEANEAAALAYGYTRDELMQLKIFDLRFQNSMDADQRLRASETGSFFETIHRRKDGTLFFVEANSQGATIHGKPVLVSIIRDISERKKADAILNKAKEDAETAYKVKSEFLANMSHEIRTPINGIMGMIDLTLLTEVNSEQQENLVTAKSCAKSLLRIINEILDFSKMEAGKLVIESIDFEIKKLIDELMLVHSSTAAHKGLQLDTIIHQPLPEFITGDPNRLRQVLNNLIDNAIKFTESGSVTLTVSQSRLSQKEVELNFAVADTGIGIAENERDKLFQSFSQVDSSITRRFGGTGLGLTISKRLIELMGGSIGFTSIKGQGSTFNFTIKYQLITARELNSHPLPLCTITKIPLTILVAEDDAVSRKAILRLLTKMGHVAQGVENGLEALALLEKNQYDLILMDIQMPQLDGIETTKRIRKAELRTGAHIPIMALTAYALVGDREKFLKLGMDYYLAKPIQMVDLFQKIEEISANESGRNTVMEEPVNLIIPHELKGTEKSMIFAQIEELIAPFLMDLPNQDVEKAEGTAHQIKILANEIDVIELKNAAFKAELAARRDNFSEAIKCFQQIRELMAVP